MRARHPLSSSQGQGLLLKVPLYRKAVNNMSVDQLPIVAGYSLNTARLINEGERVEFENSNKGIAIFPDGDIKKVPGMIPSHVFEAYAKNPADVSEEHAHYMALLSGRIALLDHPLDRRMERGQIRSYTPLNDYSIKILAKYQLK